MFERFTERARQVVLLAEKEAEAFQSEAVGPEHLLLGLIKEEEGLAAVVLRRFTVDTDLDSLPIPGPVKSSSDPEPAKTPFSVEGKKNLELALREALSLGHNYVGTEHILLALTREPGGNVEQFLQKLLGDSWVDRIREEVFRMLRGPEPTPRPDSPKQTKLRFEDILNDVATGFKHWRESKTAEGTWNTNDEMFARWIEASDLKDFL